MIARSEFIERHSKDWDRLERFLMAMEGSPTSLHEITADSRCEPGEFDRLYRLTCKHLALARQRDYGMDIVDYLNGLALRAHHVFYSTRRSYLRDALNFAAAGFPILVRKHKRLIAVSTFLFIAPALLSAYLTATSEEFLYALIPPESVRDMEEMYAPGSSYRTSERQSDSDLAMFGYYIVNNIGIDFRTFASGLLLGIGSAFFLVFNGLYFGAVLTHLTQVGYGENLYSFVATHSAPELIALVISGAAGLNLGYRLVSPGNLTRMESLRQGAHESVRLVYGAAGLTLWAAFIEAFWSSSSLLPNEVKYAAGILSWIGTLAYLTWAGRRRAA